jgi:hypothetical protein
MTDANEPKKKTRRKGPAGTAIRRGGKDGPQIVRTKGAQWTPEAQEIFLEKLHAGYGYGAAAEAAGFTHKTIAVRRHSDPAFAAECEAARAHGVARIDQLLLDEAAASLEGRPRKAESPLPPMTVQEAILVVKLHHARAAPDARRRFGGWQPRPRTLDEVRGSILTKLSAIARSRGQI